nr:ANTAR domain-containing protein [Nocardia transvalensis]
MSAGLHVADLITTQLVVARAAGLPGGAPADAPWLEQPLSSRAIHQAAGMVVAQAGVRVPDAYARLRAYAFGHALSLSEVAAAVVARRVRFDRD